MAQDSANVNRRRVRSLVAASSATVVIPAFGGSQKLAAAFSPDMQARLQQVLDRNRALFNFPGAQAGIWTEAGSWVGVSGTAAPGGIRPPARDDHTRIGSITKTFTVASMLQLVDQKLVPLDDPIGRYVPGLPNGDSATLEMLASMTSGTPTYTSDPALLKAYFSNPQKIFTAQELVNYFKVKPRDFTAGTQVSYSNTNTVALGMVIEQKAGKTFSQVLKENILVPLGLTHTFSPGSSNALPEPHMGRVTLQAYPKDTIKNATDWNPSWGSTAGNMISPLDDLQRWAVALGKGKGKGKGKGIVSHEMQKRREASMKSTVPPNSPSRTYALEFGVTNGWIGHTGELPDFNTSIQYDPRTKTSDVVMVNSDIPATGGKGEVLNPAPVIFDELIAALAA